MKRLLLYATATAMLMLVSNGVFGAQAALAPLSAIDLAITTAGLCRTCDSPSDPQPPPSNSPRVIGTEWRIISHSTSPVHQVNYSLIGEWVNSSAYTNTVIEQLSNNCRHVLTSGGIGISTGLNLSVGTTYHCATTRSYHFTIPPFTRTKLYQGDMRYYKNFEAALVQIWSDGSETMTPQRDYGVQRNDFSKYNPVHNPY